MDKPILSTLHDIFSDRVELLGPMTEMQYLNMWHEFENAISHHVRREIDRVVRARACWRHRVLAGLLEVGVRRDEIEVHEFVDGYWIVIFVRGEPKYEWRLEKPRAFR